jgi:formate hydrogenlyase transcriptional activator
MQELMVYHWPGNVRELEHIIERSMLLCNGDTIEQLPEFNNPSKTAIPQAEEIKTMEDFERDYILYVLNHCNGKISGTGGAAELLGLNVSTLNSKIKKLGIEKEKTQFIIPVDSFKKNS